MADAENTLVMELEDGEVEIALFPDKAPKHVARIKELVREGFYDGLNFHRVIDGFVAQGGCPQGSGMGGSGQNIEAEFNDVKHVRGTMSMARAADPNSADSQFFICLDAVPYLDNQYTAWGEVTSGMEHVDAIPKGEPPANPGVIKSVKVKADA
ncbi:MULTISPECIES: peptidylprolyl isomerase [Euryhalocaulis]|uniref:peptidylprolyl isomerase n=1 Tax=Euryhalocaulis TaxID=1712422 RepID=UPI0003A58307|nr:MULTISPECIES: peptidylprolyl isomerase [Euryhalocaulis]MBA4801304.1 peptidylprolyl isomerase [Euryhalocaulis sp.]